MEDNQDNDTSIADQSNKFEAEMRAKNGQIEEHAWCKALSGLEGEEFSV